MDDALTGKTQIMRQDLFRDRWSAQGKSSGILSISGLLTPAQLKQIDIFAEFDEALLAKLSPDVSLAVWKAGSVLFEEGSYIDLAFYVLEGEVELYLQVQEFLSAREVTFFEPPSRDGSGTRVASAAERSVLRTQVERAEREPGITFLSNLDLDLPVGERALLGKGELFGEIGAMSGWPQSATARTVTDCRLIQIRVPALRLLKRRSRALKARLDDRYRARTLGAQIKAAPIFRELSEFSIRALARSSDLESFEPDEVIVSEGEPAEHLYMVRSGFIKLAQNTGRGSLVVTYLSKGMLFGEPEMLLPEQGMWTATASSMQHSEVVRFPRKLLNEVLALEPSLETSLWNGALNRLEKIGQARRDLDQPELLQTAMETGLLQGTSVLVIDLDRCTRCDDCVKGCRDTHEGIPRFIREGDKYRNLLITKSCYHCRDPLCLVGCPTGAIRRAEVGAVVEIKESICIGCSACATNCPYDVIVMRDTGELWPENAIPENYRGKPRLLASKCDLCHASPKGPACVYNCPNHCAYRVGSLEEFQALLSEE
ncbi:MAG TPA: cyclic nucleotide-binding domain-containing protein [Candidatus Eisenbacteria bacterium]|nr:cyclic nucleotide-binding domain-containing protein [Candidatus Eisenbacteria bacterium]